MNQVVVKQHVCVVVTSYCNLGGNLLLRFYDPNEGTITFDGINLANLDVVWLRHQIGIVSQEPVLFATSIRENIAYGRDNATLEEVVKAADVANASEFVEKFTEKYETRVGERGAKCMHI